MGRETGTARALHEARETLAAWALRVAAANKRMAELERELAPMRGRLSQQQNEIVSLKRSLDLTTGEKARLLKRLSLADKKSTQLAQARSAMQAAEAERREADTRCREQIAALTAQLETATARAASGEKLVSEAQENLLACIAENGRLQRQLAGVENCLQDTEARAQAAREEHSTLVEEIKSRDAALTRARERIGRLAELFLQLESKANHATSNNNGNDSSEAAVPGGPPRRGEGPDAIGNAIRVSCAMLKRDLENDAWLFGGREFLRTS